MTKWMALFILFPITLLANEIRPFEGDWEGECNLSPAYNGQSTFKMRLKIEHLSEGKWTYIMQYEGQAERNYLFKLIDKDTSHYVVDEGNDVLIHTYLRANQLHSSFEVGRVRINSQEWREQKKYRKILTTYQAASLDSSKKVQSFQFLRVQDCTLLQKGSE